MAEFFLKADQLIILDKVNMCLEVVREGIDTADCLCSVALGQRADDAQGVKDKMRLDLIAQKEHALFGQMQLFFRDGLAHLILVNDGQIEVILQHRQRDQRVGDAGHDVGVLEDGSQH